MEKTPKDERVIIKKMPTKKTLQAFLEGFHGDAKVIFNREKGIFEWNNEFDRPTEQLPNRRPRGRRQ